MLAAGAEGFGIKTWFEHRFFFKTLSVHPAVNGHPALSVHPAVNGHPALSVHPAVNGHPALSVHPAVNGHPALSVHPAVNGHPALFRVEEVKRGEKEEWCPHSSYTVVWYKLAS